MPSLKCKWGVLQAGSTKLAELFPSHLLGGTSRRSSRWERWMCGVSMGFHLLLNKHKLLQCYILHHCQVAKEWSLNPFLQITPEPQESSPVTWLLEPDCPISPRALQTFVHWGVVGLSHSSGSSLFPLLYTCLCRYIETNWFYFLAFKKAWFSTSPASHHSSNTSLKARAQRLQKKIIYIYIPNWIQFYVFKFRKNASHIHTKIHQENTRGKTPPTARNTQKSTVIATVTFFWGVYSIEETSLCTGESQILWLIFLCQLVWIKSVKLLLLKKVHGIKFVFSTQLPKQFCKLLI